MENNDTNRRGWQTAANLARTGKAAVNIARAAASGGVYGAAAATKEAAPILIRMLLCMIVAAVVTTMIVFTAIPNIFFGYDASMREDVIQMTRQAASIGGVCMSLEEFESTVIDSIVTSIANEYEKQGTAIDHIEIVSYFDTESLQWFTAINSTAHQQDLEEMSVDEIRTLCSARLSYSFSLLGDEETTLRITIQKLDPDDWMEKIAPDTLQIEARTLPPDTADYIRQMEEYKKNEENEFCREMIEDNISEIGRGVAAETVRHRFFLIFQYEARMRARRNTVRAIIERMNEEADTARRYLDVCELVVTEPRYSDNFTLKLLYEVLNKHTSRRVPLPDGVFDMTTVIHGVYQEEHIE